MAPDPTPNMRARTGVVYDERVGRFRVVLMITCPTDPSLDETRTTERSWATEPEAEEAARTVAGVVRHTLARNGVEVLP